MDYDDNEAEWLLDLLMRASRNGSADHFVSKYANSQLKVATDAQLDELIMAADENLGAQGCALNCIGKDASKKANNNNNRGVDVFVHAFLQLSHPRTS